MQNLRALRQRIRSVQNTQKITRAMQMVAGAKLRRSQEELMAFRPYADRLDTIAARFLAAHPELQHPLFQEPVPGTETVPGTEKPAGLVIVTSDTGLCGTYNERLIGLAQRFLKEFPSARVVTIGRKGNRWLVRREISRMREVLDWGGKFEPIRVRPFVDWMKELFLKGEVSSWTVLYTQFISALQFRPAEAVLFPVEKLNPVPGTVPDKQIVEPDPKQFAEQLLGRYVQTRFSRILLEAFTSEHSARMVAMKNATENASQMIDTLTLVRNKARQAAITKELIEVVSGAQALS